MKNNIPKLRTGRLLKLARHLRKGQLGHKRFNFAVFHTELQPNARGQGYHCGTAGCAVGECPVIWKNHWEFRKDQDNNPQRYPLLANKRQSQDYSIGDAAIFFGITVEQARHLFIPAHQYANDWGCQGLVSFGATKEEVAAHIENFVKFFKK